jgi:hypothetical protein
VSYSDLWLVVVFVKKYIPVKNKNLVFLEILSMSSLRKNYFFLCLLILCFGSCSAPKNVGEKIDVTLSQTQSIGEQIWMNESSGKVEGLTAWNEREDFASLGIGHFIWHPEGLKSAFKESFPHLLTFVKQKGVRVPYWMSGKDPDCPWKTRKQFYREFNTPRMLELRQFLLSTISLQAEFMAVNLEGYLERVKKVTTPSEFQHVRKQFDRVAASSQGIYALVDYLNFKGGGLRLSKSYRNTAWGLMQVLQHMKGSGYGSSAVREFADCAKLVLWKRVQNAPNKEKEMKWWPGWKNRINTYVKFG